VSQPVVPPSRRASRSSAPAAKAPRAPKAPKPAVDPADPTARTGPFAKHPRLWLAGALGVAFLLLGTGAVFAGAAIGDGGPSGIGPSSTASAGRPLPAELPAASRLRTCSVASYAADERLMTLTGAVVNATSGEVLFDRSATTGIAQGGIAAVLTGAAAINILGVDTQFSTRVYAGSSPNTIVLVGGGDPTLSRTPLGSESVYAGAPKLADLATQITASYTGDIEDITTIILDTTLWSTGDKWDENWPRSLQTGGQLSEVTALQVDGDRDDPYAQTSSRSTDPVTRAGRELAKALDLDPNDVTFSLGAAVTSKPLLGEVKSQPVKVLVNQMLVAGDSTLAEHLARLVSKSMSLGGTAASLPQALSSAVAVYEVETDGISLHDGSGRSSATVIPPAFVAKFMGKVMQGAQGLDVVYNSLGVAGSSGFLASRFTGDAAIARGVVVGTTGAIAGEHAIAGTVTASDGTVLAFAFYASGAVKDNAKAALDLLVAGVYGCGDNLSNN
jgi:serine-type D-Ala-D-Ala carboxypeptidase/endopeptidase (penicillin-binding protein 4)